MTLDVVLWIAAALLVALLASAVMVTRRTWLRPGANDPSARAIETLAAELKRANDLNAGRVAALEARIERLERQGAERTP